MAVMAAITSGAMACVAFLSLIHPRGAATQIGNHGSISVRRSLQEVPTREVCIEAPAASDLSALQAMLKSITQCCGSMGCRYTRQDSDGVNIRIADTLIFTTGRDRSCEGGTSADRAIRVLPFMGTTHDAEVRRQHDEASGDVKTLVLRHEWLAEADMAAELAFLVYAWLELDEQWGYLHPAIAGRAGTAAVAAMAAANVAPAASAAEDAPASGRERIASW